MHPIQKNLKDISSESGVYFFKDKNNKVLYIGKAKNLKKRVSSYFIKNKILDKNKIMLSKANSLEYLVVNDEVEALLTEANLIKKYKPKYNIVLKDDKTFPYIIITNEDFPRVEIIREKNLHKDNNIYFGPYTDVTYLRTIVKTLHQIFPIRTCSYLINDKVIEDKKIKLCLDYHIDKCQGPCEGLIQSKSYKKMINNVIKFLKGKNIAVKNEIHNQMIEFSNKRLFEQAAKYRDKLKILDTFIKKQTKVTQQFKNRDVINLVCENNTGISLVIRIRNGMLVGREKFDINCSQNNIVASDLSNFLLQYYSLTMDIPDEIIISKTVDDNKSIELWLSQKKGKKVKIVNPQRGEAKKSLDLCIKNSELILNNQLIKKIKRNEIIPKTLLELKEVLNMDVIPKRIEAFDNSNLQGTNPVAGLVVYQDAKPLKKEYRRFNIKTVKGIDDFGSMREVVYRRYKRLLKEKKQLPDLVLIDGGKGQLSAAKSSLDKLGLGYITIIGLAKKLEEVFIPESSNPQNISKTSPAIFLLRKIRDDVHKYSIAFHKLKRNKSFIDSKLNNIKGLGNVRIKNIWSTYKTIDNFKKDSTNSIFKKTGIPINIIKDIKKELN